MNYLNPMKYIVWAIWKDRKSMERVKFIERTMVNALPKRVLTGMGCNISTGMRDMSWEYKTRRGADAAVPRLRAALKNAKVGGVRVFVQEHS